MEDIKNFLHFVNTTIKTLEGKPFELNPIQRLMTYDDFYFVRRQCGVTTFKLLKCLYEAQFRRVIFITENYDRIKSAKCIFDKILGENNLVYGVNKDNNNIWSIKDYNEILFAIKNEINKYVGMPVLDLD